MANSVDPDQPGQKYKMAAILKIYFEVILLNRKASWLETWQEVSGWLVDQ